MSCRNSAVKKIKGVRSQEGRGKPATEETEVFGSLLEENVKRKYNYSLVDYIVVMKIKTESQQRYCLSCWYRKDQPATTTANN